MADLQDTQVTGLRVRNRRLNPTPLQPAPAIQWQEVERKPRGEAFMKNLAVAAALVLCAVTLRTGAIPSLNDATDAVLTAATDQSLLDDQLGKLSFVSALFPEAVLVFGESEDVALAAPVSGGVVVHAWSDAEPNMSWRTNTLQVSAATGGEVVGVYHGNGDERLVEVMGYDGLSCLYGNLATVNVRTGDAVQAGDAVGTLLPGEDFVLEVRKDGMSMDPALYMAR